MERYFITTLTIVLLIVCIYLVFNHVRSHEKSDSEIIDKLIKRKKPKQPKK